MGRIPGLSPIGAGGYEGRTINHRLPPVNDLSIICQITWVLSVGHSDGVRVRVGVRDMGYHNKIRVLRFISC